jgi:hypothetical protein
MNMKKFLIQARELAYSEVERTGMPLKLHVDLACEVGKKLAKELGANVDIVEAGTLLMDCLIGQAIQAGKLQEHVQMSLNKANELIDNSSLSDKDKENIRHCIAEHHGADKFYSIESEICCNADCYRFTSVKGFSYAMRFLRDMPFEDLIKLLGNKVDEKWGLLSLDMCKKELAGQHETLESLLAELKEEK